MGRFIAVLFSVATLTACGSGFPDDPFGALGGGDVEAKASPALDAVELMEAESALLSVGFGTTATLPETPEEIAAQVAGDIEGQFAPSGCATASAAGATLNLAFSGCTSGPHGLSAVDGSLLMTYSASADAVSATIQATGLRASGATHTLQATASYVASGEQRSLSITSQSAGTGSRGSSVEYDVNQSSYSAQWSTADDCKEISATVQVVEGGNTTQLVVSRYTRCGRQCPTDGSITWQAVGGSSVEQVVITMDGTSSPRAISGASIGEVNLDCQ